MLYHVGQKLNAVKEAATAVLELLQTRLEGYVTDEKASTRHFNGSTHQPRAVSPPRVTIGLLRYYSITLLHY